MPGDLRSTSIFDVMPVSSKSSPGFIRVRIDTTEVPDLHWLAKVPGSLRPRIVAGLLAESVRSGRAQELLSLLGFSSLLQPESGGASQTRPRVTALDGAREAVRTTPIAPASTDVAGTGLREPQTITPIRTPIPVEGVAQAPGKRMSKGFFGEQANKELNS